MSMQLTALKMQLTAAKACFTGEPDCIIGRQSGYAQNMQTGISISAAMTQSMMPNNMMNSERKGLLR